MQPRKAEAVSLKEALSWTKELGVEKRVFEMDIKILANTCKGVQGIRISYNCSRLYWVI